MTRAQLEAEILEHRAATAERRAKKAAAMKRFRDGRGATKKKGKKK